VSVNARSARLAPGFTASEEHDVMPLTLDVMTY
jgi:hypothetical protein